jgi:hypothetical protein
MEHSLHRKVVFYPSLNRVDGNSLLRAHPNAIKDSKLIISRDEGNRDKRWKSFAVFDNLYHFAKYQKEIRDRYFYEVIPADSRQKPRFDLDGGAIDRDTWLRVVEELITSIVELMNKLGYRITLDNDIVLLSSDGKGKRSLHVVIDHYYHNNNKEARKFYELVTRNMVNRSYVDGAVYSSCQQFRIIGSRKLGTDRVKRLVRTWRYRDTVIDYRYDTEPSTIEAREITELEASMLTYVTGAYLDLKDLTPEDPSLTKDLGSNDLDREEAIRVVERASKLLGAEFPYKFRDVKGSIISLKRIRPSSCKFCSRVHEKENPYLAVSPEGMIYFYCRRAQSEGRRFGQWLGEIEMAEQPEVEPSPIRTFLPVQLEKPVNPLIPSTIKLSDTLPKVRLAKYKERKPAPERGLNRASFINNIPEYEKILGR